MRSFFPSITITLPLCFTVTLSLSPCHTRARVHTHTQRVGSVEVAGVAGHCHHFSVVSPGLPPTFLPLPLSPLSSSQCAIRSGPPFLHFQRILYANGTSLCSNKELRPLQRPPSLPHSHTHAHLHQLFFVSNIAHTCMYTHTVDSI